ncbi:MAG: hypothetical protein LBR16_05105 [Treponema sp.]|jgi:hypothetical protein|nr:hypothetical protein [Treponema sp.]
MPSPRITALLLLALLAPGPAAAEAPPPPLESLHEILSSPDFGGEAGTWGIRLRRPSERRPPAGRPSPWAEQIAAVLSLFLKALLAAGAALVLLGGARALWHFLRARRRGPRPPRGASRSAVTERARPLDPHALAGQAALLYAEGRGREAWACCLACCLACVERARGLRIPPGAAEYECLALVRERAPDEAPFCESLIRHWVAAAYAGRLPAESAFGEALAGCRALLALPPAPSGGASRGIPL